MVAVQLLIGGAYFVLRGSVDEPRRRARLAAAYALFATATMPFLTYVLPRRMQSLHPGAEGNPAFSQMDIAPQMRWVFYAASAGFLMLAWWMYTQRVRSRVAEMRTERLADAAPRPHRPALVMLQIADSLSVEAPAAGRTIAVFDTTVIATETVQTASGTERVMLSENKLPVVLAVVLIVWAAWMLLALRTDRRLARIERDLDARDASRPAGQ